MEWCHPIRAQCSSQASTPCSRMASARMEYRTWHRLKRRPTMKCREQRWLMEPTVRTLLALDPIRSKADSAPHCRDVDLETSRSSPESRRSWDSRWARRNSSGARREHATQSFREVGRVGARDNRIEPELSPAHRVRNGAGQCTKGKGADLPLPARCRGRPQHRRPPRREGLLRDATLDRNSAAVEQCDWGSDRSRRILRTPPVTRTAQATL